jgi:hypothetical protein
MTYKVRLDTIKLASRASGFDIAAATAIVIHALGGTIPWYVWLWLVSEFLGAAVMRWAIRKRGDR